VICISASDAILIYSRSAASGSRETCALNFESAFIGGLFLYFPAGSGFSPITSNRSPKFRPSTAEWLFYLSTPTRQPFFLAGANVMGCPLWALSDISASMTRSSSLSGESAISYRPLMYRSTFTAVTPYLPGAWMLIDFRAVLNIRFVHDSNQHPTSKLKD
jgi:hypothetical protein